ncbi:hypothetical protein Tco_0746143 [Tanacetum coccineum]
MKHWKSGFFFIDRRAIPDAMVWRHLDAAIDDLRPATGSFNIADVRHLSTYVVKLRDMPEGVLVLSRLSRVWKSRIYVTMLRGADGNGTGEEPYLDVRPTLQRLPFYCTPLAAADAVIPEPALEDLALGTLSSKIVAKAESSQNTIRPNLFVGDSDVESDGDDDTCIKIPLVTPLSYAFVNPPLGNQGRSSAAPASKGSNTQDSWGKGIMVDDTIAPSGGVS